MTAHRAIFAAGLALLLGSCSTRSPSPLLAVNARQAGDTRYIDEIAAMDDASYTGTTRARVQPSRVAARLREDGPSRGFASLPSIDITRSCNEARRYSSNENKEIDFRACVADETSARGQIAGLWPTTNSVDRQDCGALGRPPAPRYVEILTCLQISAGGIKPVATAAVPAAKDHLPASSAVDLPRQGLARNP